jgi:hypothetical protein
VHQKEIRWREGIVGLKAGEDEDDGKIAALTQTLASVRSWTPSQALRARQQMDLESPQVAADCLAEGEQAMMELALAIGARMGSDVEAA